MLVVIMIRYDRRNISPTSAIPPLGIPGLSYISLILIFPRWNMRLSNARVEPRIEIKACQRSGSAVSDWKVHLDTHRTEKNLDRLVGR